MRETSRVECDQRRIDAGFTEVVAVVRRGAAPIEAEALHGCGDLVRGQQQVAAERRTAVDAGPVGGSTDRKFHVADRDVGRREHGSDRREERNELVSTARTRCECGGRKVDGALRQHVACRHEAERTHRGSDAGGLVQIR
jgi:hypothetical protein